MPRPRRSRRRLEAAARAKPGLLGTLKKHRDGFGFVARVDRKGDDIFVPPDEAAKAIDGDLVRVEVVPARGGRTAGRILEVVERRRRLLVGTYHARGRQSFVIPADPELEGQVPVPETVGRRGRRRREGGARSGRRAALRRGRREDRPSGRAAGRGAQGRVREGVRGRVPRGGEGRRRSPSPTTSAPTTGSAAATSRGSRSSPSTARTRATSTTPSTSSGWRGAGKGKGLYRLVVAIADVAHYVRPGTALDDEAGKRATSVYFPMQVLPMLPERLSNGICSLNPAVDRLCMVADLVVDANGRDEVRRGVRGR